jgi:hypothetical protein
MISGIFGVQRLDPSKFRRKKTIQFKKKKLKYEFKRIFALYALAVLSFFLISLPDPMWTRTDKTSRCV